MNKYKVFVYGSLKNGYGNHSLLNGSEFINIATTVDKFIMIDLGAFPAVIDFGNDNDRNTISGELYLVNDTVLERLDQLEGHPDWYQRRVVNINNNGDNENAYMYIMQEDSFQDITTLTVCDVSNGVYNW